MCATTIRASRPVAPWMTTRAPRSITRGAPATRSTMRAAAASSRPPRRASRARRLERRSPRAVVGADLAGDDREARRDRGPGRPSAASTPSATRSTCVLLVRLCATRSPRTPGAVEHDSRQPLHLSAAVGLPPTSVVGRGRAAGAAHGVEDDEARPAAARDQADVAAAVDLHEARGAAVRVGVRRGARPPLAVGRGAPGGGRPVVLRRQPALAPAGVVVHLEQRPDADRAVGA